eukprot:5428065-Pleurochrysis_carterae.AAC.1
MVECVRVRRRGGPTCPRSLSGSAAESEAMHEMARLRVAALVEPSCAQTQRRMEVKPRAGAY